ncbi:MAG TPA: HAMP domain-containing sensor histidine kinase [Vicinamibacteria bacterium]
MRRVALVLAAVLFLSALGAASLVSMLIGGRGLGEMTRHLSPIFAAAVAGLFLAALLFAAVRRVGIPLGDIVEAAGRIAEGDYSARVREHGPPSLRMVGGAFNSMAARLGLQDRQRRHLMADIAHELRTPLSVIQGRLEGLLDGVYPRDDARLNEVLEETRILARLVEDLRTLANAESGMLALQREPTDAAILIQDVVSSLSPEADRRRVSLRVDVPSDLPLLSIDPLRIREVLANLLSNALPHTPAGGVVSITARVVDQRLVVTVADTGSGIATEDLPRIFDRFYKGVQSRGSGLGLTIARNLVTAHGGEISAESRPGQGTTITFTLPLT